MIVVSSCVSSPPLPAYDGPKRSMSHETKELKTFENAQVAHNLQETIMACNHVIW